MGITKKKSWRINKKKLRPSYEKNFFQEIYYNKTLYLMTVPAIAFFIIFSYVPMIGVYYSFVDYNYIQGLFKSPFIGLTNFTYLFSGGVNAPAWYLTRNTVLYNLVFIFLGNALQCVFAILLTGITIHTIRRISQSLMLLPYFVSFVIVGTIAYNIFNTEVGSLNALLNTLGAQDVNVYRKPNWWPFIITGFYLWKTIGYGTVVYLAAIMGIDRQIYQAAKIDGCNIFKEIWHITLPLLKPTFIMLILFSLGSIMRGQFELFYQLIARNGQLFKVTDVIDTYIYRSLTVNFNIGLSTAAGLYQSFFGLFVVFGVNSLIRRKNPDNALF